MNTYDVCIDGRSDVLVDAHSFNIVEGKLIFYDHATLVGAFSSWRSVTIVVDETESADQNE